MRLIDLDQTIFVPIIDESKGGVKYEMQMTVAEMFDKFFDGVQPEIIDAIPVEWLHNLTAEGWPDDSKAAWRVLKTWREEQEG